MKKFYTLTLLLLIASAINLKANYWTQKASFSGHQMIYQFSFSINDNGYIGCGTKYDSVGNVNFADFWMYDPVANTWTQKADFGGGQRYFAVGFAVNNKGYAGFGNSFQGVPVNDLWEYDPLLNQWMQKSSLLAEIEQPPAAFATAGYGYLCGRTATGAKLWQYDPVTDVWLEKSPCPISRIEAVSFSIGNKGYIGMGFDAVDFSTLFYCYDEQSDSWSQVASFPGSARVTPAYFSISGKGYVGMGHGYVWPLYYTDFWQYDPVTDNWAQAASYSGVPRESFSYFATSTKGYAGLGSEFQTSPFLYFNDLWEYTPGSLTGIPEADAAQNFGLTVSPNVCTDFCHIQVWNTTGRNVELFITDVHGRLIMKKEYTKLTAAVEEKIPVSGFAPGMYLVTMKDGKNNISAKFIVR